MNQNQFAMGDGQRLNYSFNIVKLAWCVDREYVALILLHQAWYLRRHGKGKSAFANVDLSIIARPRIDRAQPLAMQQANVIFTKTMVCVVMTDRPIRRLRQVLGLDAIHLPLAIDTKRVTQHPAA